jgi:hypothetical protein
MSKNMSTNRFFWVNSIRHCGTWVSHHLICDENCNVKLLWDLLNFVKEFTQYLLPFR